MNNIVHNNLKIANKKIISMSLCVLALTFMLSLIFIFNLDFDFFATKTVFGKLTLGVDGNNPGSGAQMLFSFFVSGFVWFGEFTFKLMVVLMFTIIPVIINIFLSIVNFIARLFQIGKHRNWKDIITKFLLYFSLALQGLLSIYLLLLSLSGFGIIYLIVYLMLVANVFGFVKNILYLRSVKA